MDLGESGEQGGRVGETTRATLARWGTDAGRAPGVSLPAQQSPAATSCVSQEIPAGCTPEFPGFPALRSNVTLVPLQFFTAVIPYRSRGCVRLVGYMLRRILGWVDTEGNPTCEQLEFTYQDLVKGAGISRDMVHGAIEEALKQQLIHCVQLPRKATAGDSGQSGIYRLRWSDSYTNDPDQLRGFFCREAIVESDTGVPTAKAARKNIPNAFFDYVLRRERLAVIRVVGALLFKSIRWGEGGERRESVSLSISALSNLTHQTRRNVHEAVKEALERGYLECEDPGWFDPKAGTQSRAATYRIRWTQKAVTPTYHEPSTGEGGQSEKGYGGAVGKRIRDQSEKGYGKQSEKGYDISIKRSIKTDTAAEAAAAGVVGELRKAGFDDRTARGLAARQAEEVIRNQLEWIALRQVTSSRLGMLRRAIEENWPKPEGTAVGPEHELGKLFAESYAQAYHQSKALPASPREAAAAAELVKSLKANATTQEAAEWGKRFASLVKTKSPKNPYILGMIRQYGAEFIGRLGKTEQNAGKAALASRRTAHKQAFERAHLEYLIGAMKQFKAADPDLWSAFQSHQHEIRRRLKLGQATSALLESETSQAVAFADYARSKGREILEFWEWDSKLNPEGFKNCKTGGSGTPTGEEPKSGN